MGTMGSTVSQQETNESLVDKLAEAGNIKSSSVKRVFRAVDRGFYYTDPHKQTAYAKDKSWKVGNLHLSSPIIYAMVLENLDLQPGLHFLNIGSGTGYLSTMCGLLLGRNGVNHGIELHPDVVQYAGTKLEEFLNTSPQTGQLGFCRPEFIVGNCMETAPVKSHYHRIYVGAACSNDSIGHIIKMLKIGGICIVPIGDALVKITRTGEDNSELKFLLSVTFASLIVPSEDEESTRTQILLPPILPKSLAFQAIAQIPGVTISDVRAWLETAKLVLPGEKIYDDICQYIGNSQEHQFGIKVLNIIHIVRKNDRPVGQRDFSLRKKLRMLLWHGTPVNCVPSILQHGFQPPQPAGQMFGPGIYFADRASKSANYSAKKKMNPQSGEIGYMFLCDVLLGEIYTAKNAHHDFSKPPQIGAKLFDSVKCSGDNVPDSGEQKTIRGNIVIPFGRTINNTRFDSYTVNYNEFIVYSGDRCKPNHLVEFQFTQSPEQYSKTCHYSATPRRNNN